jgi:ribonuclease P protein component
MTGQSFGKQERLLKRIEFEGVMEKGQKKKVDNICTIFWLPNGLDRQRLGVISSKKVGNAVVRNYTKRKIREVFRRIKVKIQPPVDIVVIVGKGLIPLPLPDLEKKIAQTLPTATLTVNPAGSL